MLIFKKFGGVGSRKYNDMIANFSLTNFVETEFVPRDAEVVRYTWKYVNKSGGPDKRFKDNRKLPICYYGELRMQSTTIDTLSSKMNFLVSSIEDLENKNNVDASSFKNAIKAYEDEYITGLTDEEREKIKEEIARYKKENKLDSKEDYEALNKFVEGLLKRYGFKGDIEEAAMSFVNSSNASDINASETSGENKIVEIYNQFKEKNYRI